MNNFYRKIAVASICTALSFTLVTHKKANAATFTLSGPATIFFIEDRYPQNYFGGTFVSPNNNPDSGTFRSIFKYSDPRDIFPGTERRAFYEFNINNLSLEPNTVIRKVTFQQYVESAHTLNPPNYIRSFDLEIFGYVGNGRPDLSDFGNGVSLDIKDVAAVVDRNLYDSDVSFYYNRNIRFDVTTFFKDQVKNGDAFAGFGIRARTRFYNNGEATLYTPYLIIETEPVPEPTTIFGSALALGVGGWLKRKKSSQQNKTTRQN